MVPHASCSTEGNADGSTKLRIDTLFTLVCQNLRRTPMLKTDSLRRDLLNKQLANQLTMVYRSRQLQQTPQYPRPYHSHIRTSEYVECNPNGAKRIMQQKLLNQKLLQQQGKITIPSPPHRNANKENTYSKVQKDSSEPSKSSPQSSPQRKGSFVSKVIGIMRTKKRNSKEKRIEKQNQLRQELLEQESKAAIKNARLFDF
eukprot:m.139677 g.139677  ORF g.139677 m.139677 type:complete len:201 (+) comp14806_c0_seq1:429-1031(+)